MTKCSQLVTLSRQQEYVLYPASPAAHLPFTVRSPAIHTLKYGTMYGIPKSKRPESLEIQGKSGPVVELRGTYHMGHHRAGACLLHFFQPYIAVCRLYRPPSAARFLPPPKKVWSQVWNHRANSNTMRTPIQHKRCVAMRYFHTRANANPIPCGACVPIHKYYKSIKKIIQNN